ncbi:MAG: small ribosomal subunit Rsm22 family protein [Alphaproteobacteria bacterium]
MVGKVRQQMINIPKQLQSSIIQLLKNNAAGDLSKAAADLSYTYRKAREQDFITNRQERLAYMAARMPATYAAASSVLQHLPQVKSILDIGSGTGAVAWATHEIWPHASYTGLERDPGLIEIAKSLASFDANWLQGDMTASKLANAELVTISYALNELTDTETNRVIEKLWQATDKYLCIIEPGTVSAYTRLMIVRDYLLSKGAHILAPCPHHAVCPMASKDWCHFSVRLQRPDFQRSTKQASLPYEDEKYAYLIVSKQPVDRPLGRLVKRPIKKSGHIYLDACHHGRLERLTITKRQRDQYAAAKKSNWGDDWNHFDRISQDS